MLKNFPFYVIMVYNRQEGLMMSVTIDIKVLALVVIAAAVVVLIAYLIKLLRRLIVTVERTNKILKDVEVVSEIAADRSKDVDGIISNVSDSVESVKDALSGKENMFTALTSFVKSLMMLKNAASDKNIR